MLLRKGFTLLEMLVVVLIISILVAIAWPKYEMVIEKSRSKEAFNVLAAVEMSVQAQFLANGRDYLAQRVYGDVVFNQLDVTVPALETSPDQKQWCTKFFQFSIDCNKWWDMCRVSANRIGGSGNRKCEFAAFHNVKYIINSDISFNKAPKRYCTNWSTGEHEFGEKFCDNLLQEGLVRPE